MDGLKSVENDFENNTTEKANLFCGAYINGIIEILFIISIVLSIKYPVVLVFSLIVAVAAIVINTRLLKLKK